jgi:MFS transporter, SP family, galactose:H+ symporter
MSGSLFGYNVAVVAGALGFLAHDYALTPFDQQVLVTSILVGAFAGAMGSGEVAARWGQRRTLLLASAMFLVVPPLIALTGDAWQIGALRAVLGLAVGTVSMVAPLYVAECVAAERRGALVSLFQLGVTAGILGAYLIDYAFTASGDWRVMFACGAAPSLVLAAVLATLPESPRWLALRGKMDAARAVLVRLQGARANVAELREPDDEPGRWSDLFSPLVRGVLAMAAGLFLFQNLAGIDGILYYAPAIFLSVGIKAETGAILATVGLGAVNLGATVVALLIVDRIGRRPLLIGGCLVMSASLLTVGLTLGGSSDDAALTLAGLTAYILAFAISLGPLPYVLMSEVFPLSVRARGMSLAAATSWVLNIVVAMTFLVMLDGLGAGPTFLFYAGVCAVALVFSWAMVPETRGRSLAEIERSLHMGRRLRDLGKPESEPGG